MAEPRTKRLRVVDHPLRALAFVVGVLLVAGAAFFLGTAVRSPDSAILEARDEVVPVFTQVESRSVTSAVRLQGQVSGAEELSLAVDAPAGASRSVVTTNAAQVGPLSNGAFLGTVADRPIFVFSVEVPLFRDLQPGAEGSDVSSIQKALGVAATGRVDALTVAAVQSLYSTASKEPPGGRSQPYISSSEFRTFPAQLGSLSLLSLSNVGTVLSDDIPFAVLGYGAPYVQVRASVGQASEIKPDDEVALEGSNGVSSPSTVLSVSQFQAAATEDGRPPGYDVRIAVDPASEVEPGETVSVTFGSATEPQMSVPTLAVRSDSGGDFVMKRAEGASIRADIDIVRMADGWSAIESEALIVGDEVLVSG
ncbi:efflux RND transporter periplasmic adaptor subunit [Marisediminicola senii]|uniref:hypothetical protein n=1 Tax=Marisediminicola senii TaxID=2711233 RepID=UPI0013EAE4B1|nr:hypothetical protein [Marisediminicola senii]